MLGATACLVIVHAAVAQSPARLNGGYLEQIRSDVITQSGASERHRIVARTTQFSVATRGDTVVVTADTVSLTERDDGERQAIDVDAVIGARWKLILTPGPPKVVDVPVVPRSIADVSDIGRAMDDFFPAAPPALTAGERGADRAGHRWQRFADSAGVQRYRYTAAKRGTTRTTGDSVMVESSEDVSEHTDLAWDPVHGPLAWSRRIVTGVTTRYAGRTVRALVDQHIVVRRNLAP